MGAGVCECVCVRVRACVYTVRVVAGQPEILEEQPTDRAEPPSLRNPDEPNACTRDSPPPTPNPPPPSSLRLLSEDEEEAMSAYEDTIVNLSGEILTIPKVPTLNPKP